MKTKSREKRSAILMAALAIVTERGYFDTRVDEIARRAGVAKGTVYLYFRDKPAIYIGLVDWLLEQALAAAAEVMARPISPSRKLEELFSTWASGVMSHPGVLALLSTESIHQHNTVMKRFKKHVWPHIIEMQDAVASIVKQGIEQGEFRPVEPSAAAVMYLSAFRSELLSAKRPMSTRRAESIKELFFCGILAEGSDRTKHGSK